jgi:hypothetical protein
MIMTMAFSLVLMTQQQQQQRYACCSAFEVLPIRGCHLPSWHRRTTLTGRLNNAKTNDPDNNINDTPTNTASSSSTSSSFFSKTEFSRSISTERIFKTSSGNYRQTNQRDYEMDITASTEECQLLAQRFDLKNIAQLNATLSLQLDSSGSSSSGSGSGSSGTERFANGQSAIQVEGTIHAKVTQTCVRTNEDFQVDLDLPLFAIVRPAVPASQQTARKNEPEELNNNSNNNKSSGFTSKTDKKGKNKKNGPAKTNYKDDMQELQRLLAQQESFEAAAATKGGGKNNNNNNNNNKKKNTQLDDFFSSILEEDGSIVEDEAIYSAVTGQLDVGELVAQTFWLQLDPYPKKPGTRPIQISISG